MSTIVLLIGVVMFALGAIALIGAQDAVHREQRKTDGMRAERDHARQRWSQAEARLIIHIANEGRADFERRLTLVPDEPTPLHDDVAVVRLRRDLDAWGEES